MRQATLSICFDIPGDKTDNELRRSKGWSHPDANPDKKVS